MTTPPDPCLEQRNAKQSTITQIGQLTDQVAVIADQIAALNDLLDEQDAILQACLLEHSLPMASNPFEVPDLHELKLRVATMKRASHDLKAAIVRIVKE